MTLNEYLQQIKERLDMATKGPWKYDAGNWEVEGPENRRGICQTSAYADDCYVNPSDGDFIASCPTDISNLLAVISIYQEALDSFYNNHYNCREAFDHCKKALKAAEEVIKK